MIELKKVNDLQKENKQLNNECAEQTHYKRRWNLRLTGLPEKEGEDTRESYWDSYKSDTSVG